MKNNIQIGDIVKHKDTQTYGIITNITIFTDRTCYSVIWFGEGDEAYDEFDQRELIKVS